MEHKTHSENHSERRDAKKYATGFSDKLQPLEALDLGKVKNFDDLARAMSKTAFGGRNLGEAADVLHEMATDKDCFVVGTFSGAMTVAKMGLLICDMIDRGMLNAIVSTGALMTHGFVESVGMRHFKYNPKMDDVELYDKGYDRVYDTLELEKNLDDTEELFNKILEKADSNEVLYSQKITHLLGEHLSKHVDGRSILKSAYEKKVPVYIPAFTDSELGLDLGIYMRRQKLKGVKPFQFNPFLDLEHYTEQIKNAKKVGIFTIGGGVPRNWAQQVGPYLDIIDKRIGQGGGFKRFHYGLRICPEPVHWGGLCLHGDTKIDMPRDLSKHPEGISIKELVGKSDFAVYSYDTNKNRVVLANARGAWKTGNKKMYKLTYGWVAGWASNKKELKIDSIVASGDHKFMLKNGNYKKLSELRKNDRLMPFNHYYKADKHGNYRFISLNNGKKLPEHRFIIEEMQGKALSIREAIHHIDHNTLNNNIENLKIMDFIEHARHHRITERAETRQKRIKTLKEICDPKSMSALSRRFWTSLSEEEYGELCKSRSRIGLRPEESARRSNVAKIYWNSMTINQKNTRLKSAHTAAKARWASISEDERSKLVSNERNGRWIKGVNEEDIRNALIRENGVILRAANSLGISTKVFSKRMKFYNISNQWIEKTCVENHFVISIEYYGEEESYDMAVDNTHNFAANGIIVSNSGCTYSEGVSWGKFVPQEEGGRFAEVLADATIAWPVILKAVFERMDKR